MGAEMFISRYYVKSTNVYPRLLSPTGISLSLGYALHPISFPRDKKTLFLAVSPVANCLVDHNFDIASAGTSW